MACRASGLTWRLAGGGAPSGLGGICSCTTMIGMHSGRAQHPVCHGGVTATLAWPNPPVPVLAASSQGKAMLWWHVQAAMQGCPGEAAQAAAHHCLPPGRQAEGPGS